MFNDLKYIPEQKKVVVSNEEGKMNEFSYQDNIKDILILKNVIEELEVDKAELNTKQGKLEEELKKCFENRKEKKKHKIFLFIGITLSYTILPSLFMLISDFISGVVSSISTKVEVTPWLGSLMTIWMLLSYFCLTPRGNLKKQEKEIQKQLNETKNQLPVLEETIVKNKEKIKELEGITEINDMNKVPNTIVPISYHEELELQRAYLLEMYNKRHNEEDSIAENKNNLVKLDLKKKKKK